MGLYPRHPIPRPGGYAVRQKHRDIVRLRPFTLARRPLMMGQEFRFATQARMMINPISWLILTLLEIYSWVIIAAVISSWLVNFGVINAYNPMARSILHVLAALTEPVFSPIRRILPPMGGLDLSPIIALLLVMFLTYVVVYFPF